MSLLCIHMWAHICVAVLSNHVVASRTVVSPVDKFCCTVLRLFYTITAEKEEGERTKDKEEDNCKRYLVCEGLTQCVLKDMHNNQLFFLHM